MLSLLNRWRAFPPLSPDTPFYAVGDIHGCYDLLLKLFSQLEPDLPVVCVGDYIDRGPQSAAVLRFLQARSQPSAGTGTATKTGADSDTKGQGPAQLICLKGNHEAMLLRFVDNPARGAPWLRYGGVETLESFGIPVPPAPEDQAQDLHAQLVAALGPDLIAWLRELSTFWRSGNVAVTHAGADPRGPIEAQDPKHLIWGHPDFARLRRRDGTWVVHGHVIQSAASQTRGQINIDTGAFATGRLTAARIAADDVTFVEVSG